MTRVFEHLPCVDHCAGRCFQWSFRSRCPPARNVTAPKKTGLNEDRWPTRSSGDAARGRALAGGAGAGGRGRGASRETFRGGGGVTATLRAPCARGACRSRAARTWPPHAVRERPARTRGPCAHSGSLLTVTPASWDRPEDPVRQGTWDLEPACGLRAERGGRAAGPRQVPPPAPAVPASGPSCSSCHQLPPHRHPSPARFFFFFFFSILFLISSIQCIG